MRPHPLDGPPPAPSPERTPARANDSARAPSRGPGSKPALVGLCIGLVIGVLLVTLGFNATLLIALCAGVGAALGMLIHGGLTGRLDPAAAWRALRRGN